MTLAEVERHVLAWLPFGEQNAWTPRDLLRQMPAHTAQASVNLVLGKLRKAGSVKRVLRRDELVNLYRPHWYRVHPRTGATP